MPLYLVTHRVTDEQARIEAPYAQDACNMLGWLIGDCHVKLLREGPFTYIARNTPAATEEADDGYE